jgi:hypothetical protein
MPRLVVQGRHGTSGERAALGLTLKGRVDGALVLPTGMTLSIGSDIGADAWQAPVTDAVLSNTWVIPPKDSIGVVDLFAELQLADTTIAHRWPIHLEWAAATPSVDAPTPAIEAQRVAVAAPRQPMPPHRELDREEIASTNSPSCARASLQPLSRPQ